MSHSVGMCCRYWEFWKRHPPRMTRRSPLAWRFIFWASLADPPLQGDGSDIRGVPEVFAARVYIQRYQWVPFGRSVRSCLLFNGSTMLGADLFFKESCAQRIGQTSIDGFQDAPGKLNGVCIDLSATGKSSSMGPVSAQVICRQRLKHRRLGL